ncbi:hypothetical protein SM8_032315 [Streptomyces sp. SM8]|nr:hypothetical protein SM8_032315 [Streptomyces sp. SM8]
MESTTGVTFPSAPAAAWTRATVRMVSSLSWVSRAVTAEPCRWARTVESPPVRATSTPRYWRPVSVGRPAWSHSCQRSTAASTHASGMTESSSDAWNSPNTRLAYMAESRPHCRARCSAHPWEIRPAAIASSRVTWRTHQSSRPGARRWMS